MENVSITFEIGVQFARIREISTEMGNLWIAHEVIVGSDAGAEALLVQCIFFMQDITKNSPAYTATVYAAVANGFHTCSFLTMGKEKGGVEGGRGITATLPNPAIHFLQ